VTGTKERKKEGERERKKDSEAGRERKSLRLGCEL
jgi:hypothetical protein